MPNGSYPVLPVLGLLIKMLVVMRCYGAVPGFQTLPGSPDTP